MRLSPQSPEPRQRLRPPGSAELQFAALDVVRDKRDVSRMDDVVRLMVRTEDQDVQYSCIKTLAVLTGRVGPGRRAFREHPWKYVEEWSKCSEPPS